MAGDTVPPRVLTIAGSDPSGGAGVQADLKTFHAFGCYGMAVLTALTAQNTIGVRAVHVPPASFVAEQLHAILDDCPPAAIKTGMLFSAEIIETVADVLAERSAVPLVVDPVAVATSGDRLLEPGAVDALLRRLIPLATVVTPNASEAGLLCGVESARSADDVVGLLEAGAGAVLLKGGHGGDSDGCVSDTLLTGGGTFVKTGPRAPLDATHGTGCTLSAGIAAALAGGSSLETAVSRAFDYVNAGLHEAFPVGGGATPVNHLRPAPPERGG